MAVIENTIQKSNIIVSAKIIALTNKMITFITQDGQHLLVPVTQSEREDVLFLPSLKDIWHAELWIPVNQKTPSVATIWLDGSSWNSKGLTFSYKFRELG